MYRLPALAIVAFVAMGLTSVNPTQQTYDTLKAAGMFTVGGVGIVGTVSGEEQAFRKLLQQPDATDRCKKLLQEATPAGQMYALLGFTPARLGGVPGGRGPLQGGSGVRPDRTSGCIVIHLPAAHLAQQIAAGNYQ